MSAHFRDAHTCLWPQACAALFRMRAETDVVRPRGGGRSSERLVNLHRRPHSLRADANDQSPLILREGRSTTPLDSAMHLDTASDDRILLVDWDEPGTRHEEAGNPVSGVSRSLGSANSHRVSGEVPSTQERVPCQRARTHHGRQRWPLLGCCLRHSPPQAVLR